MMQEDKYTFNKTWQDKVHTLPVNYPKDLWEMIAADARYLHTSAADVIRTRLRLSYCKDRLPQRAEIARFKADPGFDPVPEPPKRFQGFLGLLQRNKGFFFKSRRLREGLRQRDLELYYKNK